MSSSCILLELVHFMVFSYFIVISGRQCGPPTPPSGSIIIHPLNAHKLNHNNGNVVLFGCKQGLYLLGSPIIKCSGNTWTKPKFKCKGICPEILRIPNGIVIPAAPRLGYSAVEFRCNRSYLLIGRSRLECINGRWNGRLPFCEAVVCPYPAIPKNAYIVHPVGDRLNYTHGTTMFLACREGHYLTGLPMLICNGTSWSKIEFTCTASCANLGPVDNAVITHVTMEGGGEVQIHCRTNYILVGESNLKCVDGRWNASLPSCKAPCKDPGVPVNGTRFGDDFRHEKSVTFQCPDEFILKGKKKIHCQDGTWNADRPTCEVIECNDPGTPKDGKQAKVINHYSYPGSVEFQCSQNYTMRGNAVINCQKNKRWDGSVPECLAPCKDPGVPANGTRDGNDFGHGKSVTFQCPDEYNLKGQKKINCKDGRWSDDIPTCEVIKCDDPGTPKHGRKAEVINNYFYRGSVRFECYQNYTMQGKDVVKCMRNNQWDHSIPSCLAPCKHPGMPLNGFIVGDGFTHGSTIRFHCLEDFALRGASSVVCSNGQWDGEKPSCEVCNSGFPLGMGDGQIPDRSISASSFKDALHAPHYGRLGQDTYWCSNAEKESYIEIHLSKPYKITAMNMKTLHKEGISLYILKTEFDSKWIYLHKEKPDTSNVQRVQLGNPVISRSLRIVVQRKEDQYQPVCMSVEIYGCNTPRSCIMLGSVVITKRGTSYTRAYVRLIKGDWFEVFVEGGSGRTILKRTDVVLDEEPSLSELTKGTLVLGRDMLSGQMKRGHLEVNLGSTWTIKSSISLWRSNIKDIRVIKTETYC